MNAVLGCIITILCIFLIHAFVFMIFYLMTFHSHINHYVNTNNYYMWSFVLGMYFGIWPKRISKFIDVKFPK